VGFEVTQTAPEVAFIDHTEDCSGPVRKENCFKKISLEESSTFVGFQPAELHDSGNDAAFTLVVLLSLAFRILGKDTYGILEEVIPAALMSAKTAKRRTEMKQEEQVVIHLSIATPVSLPQASSPPTHRTASPFC
jgi:hypothetical protein